MLISDLIITDKEQVLLDDLILDATNRQMLNQLIREYAFKDELNKYGLPVDHKLLLHGASGCGKTATAKAIAASLRKKLLILNLSNVVSAKIGETGQHLKLLFEKAAKEDAVLFLDEFDQLGKVRSLDDRDVGEMRRLVNTLIQLIDYLPTNAMLICATNHDSFIDPALLRRFQLKLAYTMPDEAALDHYYDRLLKPFPEDLRGIERQYGISFAEVKDYTITAVKAALIAKLEKRDG